MPNYITHWLIADRTAAALKDTVFQGPVSRYRHALLIGAVFHDALFYLPSDPSLAGFAEVASRLHGANGEDTFFILKKMTEAIRNREDGEELSAFTAGLACHIMSDAVFHPFIFFHTGRVNAERKGSSSRATQAHRRLETLLDLHFAGGLKEVRGYSLKEYLKKAGGWAEELYDLAGQALAEPDHDREWARGLAAALDKSFSRFAAAQTFFQNRVAARLLFGCRKFMPDPLREIVALGSHGGLRRYLPEIREPLTYRHPVTGRESVTTVEELFDQAVEESAKLCRNISDLLATGRPWPVEWIGPGLSSGLPETPAHRLREFAPQRLAGPGSRSRG